MLGDHLDIYFSQHFDFCIYLKGKQPMLWRFCTLLLNSKTPDLARKLLSSVMRQRWYKLRLNIIVILGPMYKIE